MRKKAVSSARGFISVILSAVLLSSCAVEISSSEPASKATSKPVTVATAAPTAIPTPVPAATTTPTPIPAAVATAQPEAKPVGSTYILNTNTKKFHVPTCASVSKMKDKNKREFTGTIDEAISQGYEPCKRCIGN